ncbi:MAG: NAD(P)(+) transhydrogenase (Re/Si-specific) subunit beta [Bacteroidia bacterium]
MSEQILNFLYWVGVVGMIWGLHWMAHPRTARKGNTLALVGMIIVVLATGVAFPANLLWSLGGVGVAALLGITLARRTPMTHMPQMVSLLNGLGGGASFLVILSASLHGLSNPTQIFLSLLTLFVGALTFTGSLVAYAKLEEKIPSGSTGLPPVIAALMPLLSLGLILYATFFSYEPWILGVLSLLGLAYGVLFVLPIGGADMPVAISLLNAFSGIAAALVGIAYHNQLMLLAGILVGASGTILTIIMARAMNRSLFSILSGTIGGQKVGTASGTEGVYKEMSYADAAPLLRYAKRVVVIPGYGLAVSQAQTALKELDKTLTEANVEVLYGIHPVAGRMPGHMNVLLAEADIPYERLLDLDPSNEALEDADVALIIGANDVVNPSARRPDSPIAGMPILNADKAKNVLVIKRGRGKGYAGIENELFFLPHTYMLFGDAKKVLQELLTEVKSA